MQQLLHALLFACVSILQDPAAPAPASDPAAKAAAEVEALEELAGELQYAITEGETADLEALIDADALLAKATAGVEVDQEFRRGFVSGARETLFSSFHDALQKSIGASGSLRFLRIRKLEQGPHLLFRQLSASGGVEYLEFSLLAGTDGRLRVDDWYLYATGEWVSETIHRLYLPFVMQRQRGLLDRLLGKDQLIVKHWDRITKLVECAQKHDVERGLAIYRKLPEDLRHEKFVLLVRLGLLAGNTDHEDYPRLLEDLRRYCPGDPVNELHAIDYHYLRKEWSASAEAVRRLAASLGGDPYLDYLEATLLVQMQDNAGARRALEKSVAAEPERLEAHWLLVTVCLSTKDHAAVLEALKRIDGLFEMQWKDLSTTEEYKGFAASPEHAQWLTYLAQKPKK